MNFKINNIYIFTIMLKKNLQSKTGILIIGGASKIARQAFKDNKEYDVVGFSKFSKVKK